MGGVVEVEEIKTIALVETAPIILHEPVQIT
jgi:hypothetical protein